jgi:ankyrin repeat protein
MSLAMHDAVMPNNIEALKALIGSNPNDVNAKTGSYGDTPLHVAAEFQRSGHVQPLLQNGADVDARDNGRATPLHRAASKGDIEIIGLLLNAGADVNAKDCLGQTPLRIAVGHRHEGAANALRTLRGQ